MSQPANGQDAQLLLPLSLSSGSGSRANFIKVWRRNFKG
jgi:hypothetical protein